mmetsp:Transcript_123617/g.350060  ORF Transcript_123617/g.350060 Transcript_123617/m.350060 type:complete len:213 (+) Transcript_123617:373-1011(+)
MSSLPPQASSAPAVGCPGAGCPSSPSSSPSSAGFAGASSCRQVNWVAHSQSVWLLETVPSKSNCKAPDGWLQLRSPHRMIRGGCAPLAQLTKRWCSRISCTCCNRHMTWSTRIWRANGWKKRCVLAMTKTSPVALCLTTLTWKMVDRCGSTPLKKSGHFALASRTMGLSASELRTRSRKRNSFSSMTSNAPFLTKRAQPSETWPAFNVILAW